MDGPKFGRAGARRPAARIGGWRPKNWKSGDQSRCRERPEFGNDPELEQCGPKIGKARQPAASGGSRRLEKSVFKYHKYCVEDGLSVDTPECRSGVSFLPAPADPPPTPTRRPTGCPADADPPSHWLPRRSPPPPGATGLDWLLPPVSSSRRTLGSSSPPTPTRRPTGCPVGRRRLCRLPRRSLLPAGLSGVPPRRRRPVASRGCRSRLVAPPPAAPSRRTLGSSSPPTPTRRLPGPPVSTGCPAGRRRLSRLLRRPLLPAGLSGVPPRRRRPAVPLVAPSVAAASAGCCAGLFFPPAIPIDPPVSPFAGPPRRTGGVCLPFGRNGGRKCRSRLEYCAEFPSFVTPKHQYHEKPPPRTLCVCGLLQCSAGRMLRA